MSNSSTLVVEPESNTDTLALLERLDPAIGEATTVVGAMLTELLRRTLRGGVSRIGDEMHGYVTRKVDTVIAERTPGLEQLAAEVAEHTARSAATEVATEEVHALEQRTQAGDRELAGQISEAAAALAAQLRETEERAQVGDRDLAGQITETSAALAEKIRETEQRTQAELKQLLQTLADRARERRGRLKTKFTELDGAIAALGKQLEKLRQDLARVVHDNQAKLVEELRALKEANSHLAARVAELEKPRGLRALWARLVRWFRRSRAKAAEPAAS